MNSKLFKYLFGLIVIVELISHIIDSYAIHHITKPLLMPVLALYFFFIIKQRQSKFTLLLFISLFFSWLGDSFLLYQAKNEIYFMLGLGSFLIAHVLYIYAYIISVKDNAHKSLLLQKPWVTLPILIYGIALISYLLPKLGELLVPVIVYSLTILLMVISAIHRYGRTTSQSFWLILAGACVFVLSDSMIAINKFVFPIPKADLLIMFTYITGQYLIIEGAINHIRNHQGKQSQLQKS